MGKRIDAETRAQIVQTYLENEGMSYKAVAERFGVATESARKIINEELEAGNGIKPDRSVGIIKLPDGIEFKREELEAQHPRTSDWMDHVKPLNANKRELELAIEHKQAELDKAKRELDKAKQELRDFTATLRQLMEGDV